MTACLFSLQLRRIHEMMQGLAFRFDKIFENECAERIKIITGAILEFEPMIIGYGYDKGT